MKKLFFLLLFTLSITSHGQSKKDRNGNLIGYIKKSDLLNLKHKGWFNNKHPYEPNEKIVRKIKKNLQNISIKAFVGTWCHDSKRVISRFYQIMEATEFDLKGNFKMIGITRGKKTPDNLQEGYNIRRTPTLIFFKDGKEIGRFVEHSQETLEKDILKIIRGKNYKHAYQE